MVSETRFVGFWPWSDNREGHFNMAPCWAGGRGGGGLRAESGWDGEAAEETNIHQIVSMSLGMFLCTQVLPLLPPQQTEKVTTHFKSPARYVCAGKHLQHTLGLPLCLPMRLFWYSDAERRMHLGSRQFHYTESSCFSSGSRPLCRLPSTENWKHGTNNIMCYSNFALGLVICPSAVTSVADRADVPVPLPAFRRLHSLKLSRLYDRSAIVALSANYFCYLKKKKTLWMVLCFCVDVEVRSVHWKGLESNVLYACILAG